MGWGVLAQLVECLLSMHEPIKHNLAWSLHLCHPNSSKAEAGGSEVQRATLNYIANLKPA